MTTFHPISRQIDSRDDHYSYGLLDIVALVAVLAFLLGLSGCMPDYDHSESGAEIAALVWEEWSASELREPSDYGKCGNLLDFRVWRPATFQEYLSKCPAKSAACQVWQLVPSRRLIITEYRPMAVMNPEHVDDSNLARTVLHEYLHAMSECANYSRAEHYNHVTPLIWEHRDDDVSSVEERVQARL